MTFPAVSDPLPPAKKQTLSKSRRALRFLASLCDPRTYFHALRLLNYYNYAHVAPRRRLTLGPGVALSPTATFAHAERISIGAGSHIGTATSLWAGPSEGRIDIGAHCLLGPGVRITAANYRFRDGVPAKDQTMQEAHVEIGRDVWIGAGAILLPGVSIGDGAIIGAGAIVSKSVTSGQIVVGSRARVIGERWPESAVA